MATSRLAAFFPVPRFMTLPAIGVDISDTSLKYVALERHHGRLSLAAYGELPLPEGCIERGEIRQPAAIEAALREVRKATGADYARVALPEERAYLFETSLEAGLSPEEIRTALEFRLEENVPLAAQEALFDFDLLDAPAGGTQPVSVEAYHRATAEGYYRICRAAGMVPLALEVEPAAVARAIVPAYDTATRLILDFGKTRCGIGIVHRGLLLYTSTIAVGGREIDASIKAAYPDADDEALVSLKNETGLLRSEEHEKLGDAIMPHARAIRDELAANLAFWHSHAGAPAERRVTEILLAGGLANMAGFAEYLAEETGIPAARASVWRHIFREGEVPPITKRRSYGFATAVGLALGGFISNEP